MKAVLTALAALCLAAPAQAQVGDVDLLSLLAAQPGMAERLGLHKLTAPERAAWNELLDGLLRSRGGPPSYAPLGMPPAGVPAYRRPLSVFEGVVDDFSDDLVQLSNGAAVELLGAGTFARYRQPVALVGHVYQWSLWVEEVGTLPVRLVRQPVGGGRAGEYVTIAEVLEYGEVLRLADGRVLQVEPRDAFYADAWSAPSEAILVDGALLLGLQRGESVRITARR